ncbi:MAG: CocE/NonD family hydrolase [Caldithrix sp.]|nr:CocE/NonD family hydrolase [Caldithrix sp.]
MTESNIMEWENVWIPMPDGIRLAAHIRLPVDAETNPVPAILEYIPYRKRDMKVERDSRIHGYFAQHGYAGVRVDLRGSGDSDGVLTDEYLQQELDDGLEILRWLEQQTWCNGKVGIFGLSWGGFNGLQMSALNPPQLKAVITVCSSDDRYADDIHYMGGCLLTDNLSWASTMFAFNSCPPDPQVVESQWKERWLDRLQGSGLWLKKWMDHQPRDDYWKHASVCEDYSAIKAPVFAVSGWADGYSNTVFRLMEHLDVPRKGLIGAWGHKYPHMGGPGPAIDFLGECIRWWDHWLKDQPNGVMDEPMLRLWMQDSASPIFAKRPGRWVAEQSWPAKEIHNKEYKMTFGQLTTDKPTEPNQTLPIQSPLSVGLFAGKWCSYAEQTDLPWDQREEDGGALTFDTEPLSQDVEILGAPVVHLQLEVNKPNAMVAVRLSDIAPNDRATRITYGLLNLTHHQSHEYPKNLQPGKPIKVAIPMNHVAQRFAAGHRIRVAVSTSYWPLAWPSPEPVKLQVHTGQSCVQLPVRPPRQSDESLRDLGTPKQARGVASELIAPAERYWTVSHNLANNTVTLNVINKDKRYRLPHIDMQVKREVTEKYTYVNNNYDTLRAEVESHMGFRRGDWQTLSITRTVLTSTRTHFRIRATLDAYEGDARIFSKSWDERIERQWV